MSKIVFISYANEAMAYSLKRIGRQARRLGIFDEVILYTPEDVPDYVRRSPLFSCPRGAGYWCWKPAMIHETLQRNEEGTVVVYVDAGCTLRKSPQWTVYLSEMDRYDTLCFQYADSQPQWKKWGSESSRIKYWTKASTLDFIVKYFNNPDGGEFNQIMGGVLFMKGRENRLLKTWKGMMFGQPELVMDPTPKELESQRPYYAGHRHDQTLLTPLAMNDPATLVLPEISEAYRKDSFVWASRIRARNVFEFAGVQFKHYMRIWLGDQRFEQIKDLF